ncbi:sulfotransferase domain-containing protein [Cyclobacterium amurskyense]|uniref:Sulfotransferase domain-containing protein n=1 Tax=Cyclobacterium amurskyense TaxID=320787 RepID=A0A0H4PEZ6_9BACT|nr:sulfotransferase domain-containing protein [Cyclobacterium amurskyense]AKP53031.1 hypothetical protein CA2015_3654 [Cyclobacterium amurskyense]
MLIIAIPKSASTSLMLTISKLHQLKSKQDFSFSKNRIPENCNIIHQFHSDIRELSNAEFLNNEHLVYKQHIYPSSNNLKLTTNIKKVVLLRDPTEIILAYRRGAIKSIHNLLKGYSIEMDDDEWVTQSKQDGLFFDLNYFYNEWKEKANPDNTLLIYYNEYVENPKQVINRIEKFYDLKTTKRNFSTVKARFTRRSNLNNFIYIYSNKLKDFFLSLLVYLKLKFLGK